MNIPETVENLEAIGEEIQRLEAEILAAHAAFTRLTGEQLND